MSKFMRRLSREKAPWIRAQVTRLEDGTWDVIVYNVFTQAPIAFSGGFTHADAVGDAEVLVSVARLAWWHGIRQKTMKPREAL